MISMFFDLGFITFYWVQYLKMIPGLQGDSMSTDHFVHFIGGGLAGITAATTSYPLDLVRTRLAAQVTFWVLVEAFAFLYEFLPSFVRMS